MTKLQQKLAEVRSKYHSYEAISPQDKAWITMYGTHYEKSPKMVHAGLKAYYARKRKKVAK